MATENVALRIQRCFGVADCRFTYLQLPHPVPSLDWPAMTNSVQLLPAESWLWSLQVQLWPAASSFGTAECATSPTRPPTSTSTRSQRPEARIRGPRLHRVCTPGRLHWTACFANALGCSLHRLRSGCRFGKCCCTYY